MKPRPSTRDSTPGILDRALLGGRLAWLKRYSRWFNLTVIQHAIWPLLILAFNAPQAVIEDTPPGWFTLRLFGPLAAALLAWVYTGASWERLSRSVTEPFRATGAVAPGILAAQARYVVIGLTVTVAIMRLLTQPAEDALKIILFGLVTVAAFHLIHFGVVPSLFADRREGLVRGVILFGLSWGLFSALYAGLSEDESWALALAGGIVAGWIVAVCCLGIRRWPGGALTAAAAQLLVIHLIFGFV